jgi:DNA-directed RNA polymerase subunit alpha
MEFAYLSESVKIKKISEESNKGVFEVEGLYPGYGLTLGNSLRRVLMSSLPGAAVTRFKIKGIKHEFTTITDVMEDVVELGLNLKKVRFGFFAKEPQVLSLKVKGEKEVKAGDIEGTADVQVQNADLHIATLTSKDAELDMEITVEKGLGYVQVEDQKADKLSIGTIALDAIFSPVRNVNFTVENMRVGDRTNYNRLKLEIETDGTITPSSALHKSANILIDHYKRVADIEIKDSKADVSEEKIEEVEEEVIEEKVSKPAKKKSK